MDHLRGILVALALLVAVLLLPRLLPVEPPMRSRAPEMLAPPQTLVTKGRYPACLTEEALTEAMRALARGDEQWLAAVPGCVLTVPGLRVGVIDQGMSRAKVRLFAPDGSSVVVWTNAANVGTR